MHHLHLGKGGTGSRNQSAQLNPRETANIPDMPNTKRDNITGKRRRKVERDPLFMKATVVQDRLHRPMQRRVRLLQKQGLVTARQSSAYAEQKREELGLDLPFMAGNSLLGYMTAEINFLEKLYLWSFEEDLGSEKPTQHRKREKQLPREEQPSEVRAAEEQRKCQDNQMSRGFWAAPGWMYQSFLPPCAHYLLSFSISHQG